MESSEEKGEMVLCLLTRFQLVGIHLGKVEEREVVALNSKSAPVEFHVNFEKCNLPVGMCRFNLGSQIYLTGGGIPLSYFSRGIPSKKIYKFDINGKQLLYETNSISPLPRPQPVPKDETLVANILGDTYFLQENPMVDGRDLLVLDSKREKWEYFPPPPIFDNFSECFFCMYEACFVLQNKLYLLCEVSADRRRSRIRERIYCFDPKTRCWTREHYKKDDGHILNSFRFKIDGERQFCIPKITISLPDFNSCIINSSIVLASSYIKVGDGDEMDDEGPPTLTGVRIYGFLVNQHGIWLSQPLEELFEGILPSFIIAPVVIFIELGNSRVCALICGKTMEHRNPVLCISVFTLAKAKLIRVGRFLSVRVLAKHVFTVKNLETPLLDAFICRLKKNTKMSKKRKELPH